jgi:hypothetical protein
MLDNLAPLFKLLDGELAPIRRVIFPGLPPNVITRYEDAPRSTDRQALKIPETYKHVLLRLNGATLFRMNLFGLPASMCADPPMLDRSARQPLDLRSGAETTSHLKARWYSSILARSWLG